VVVANQRPRAGRQGVPHTQRRLHGCSLQWTVRQISISLSIDTYIRSTHNQAMTLADKVTSLRLIMAPAFFVIYLFVPGGLGVVITLWALYIISEITDLLDGIIARRQGEISDFGKLFDPFADTLTQITYFLCFGIDGILSPFLVLAVLYREFFILFVRNLMLRKGITLGSEEATICLTGIYADTGRFIYENVSREDLEVAAWLLDMGASLRLVKGFLDTIRDDEQIAILNQLLLLVQKKLIRGHEILISYLEINENIPGLAPVVEKIMDIENPDAYFAIFYVRKTKTILIIARSQKHIINLHALLSAYGGGGHELASSLLLREQEGPRFYEEFLHHLHNSLPSAIRVKDVMTKKVFTLNEDNTVMNASIYMEEINHTGLPVKNKEGKLTGFISLRDIMKARRASRMNSPVSAYMTKGLICSHPDITMREAERLFYKHRIGHLPVMDGETLIGIVTRWDLLEYKKHREILI